MDLYLLIRRYVDFFKCVAPRGNIRMLLIYNYKMIIYWSIIKKCSQCFVTLPWFHREPLVVDFCIVWCPVQEYIAWMKDVALHKPSKVHFFCQRLVCTDVTPFFFYIDMVSSEKNLRQTLEFILYREFLFQMIVTHLWRIYQSILAFYTILLHPYNLNAVQNFRIGEEKQRNICSVNNVNTEIICVYVSQLNRHAKTFIKSRQATDK